MSLDAVPGSLDRADTLRATDQCADGGTKDESAPFTFTAPGGMVVANVCVKAGTSATVLVTSNGCYAVSGVGTTEASVEQLVSSRSCKDISYVTFYAQAPTPTPTPVAPTPTPTPVAPTPTPTPVAPTPTPTPIAPTPTPTPLVVGG